MTEHLLMYSQNIVQSHQELHERYQHDEDIESGTACHQIYAKDGGIQPHSADISLQLVLHAQRVGSLDKA